MAKGFKIKRLSAGERIYQSLDKLDTFNVIIKGKVGIFYPDLAKIKQIQDQNPTRIVCITESEANIRRIKRKMTLLAK